MNKSGLKDPASMSEATSYADKCRAAPANGMKYEKPSGPKPEPVKVNGVPMIAERGVSK